MKEAMAQKAHPKAIEVYTVISRHKKGFEPLEFKPFSIFVSNRISVVQEILIGADQPQTDQGLNGLGPVSSVMAA